MGKGTVTVWQIVREFCLQEKQLIESERCLRLSVWKLFRITHIAVVLPHAECLT